MVPACEQCNHDKADKILPGFHPAYQIALKKNNGGSLKIEEVYKTGQQVVVIKQLTDIFSGVELPEIGTVGIVTKVEKSKIWVKFDKVIWCKPDEITTLKTKYL